MIVLRAAIKGRPQGNKIGLGGPVILPARANSPRGSQRPRPWHSIAPGALRLLSAKHGPPPAMFAIPGAAALIVLCPGHNLAALCFRFSETCVIPLYCLLCYVCRLLVDNLFVTLFIVFLWCFPLWITGG